MRQTKWVFQKEKYGVEVGRPSCRSRFEQQEQGTEAERLGHAEEMSNKLSQQKTTGLTSTLQV